MAIPPFPINKYVLMEWPNEWPLAVTVYNSLTIWSSICRLSALSFDWLFVFIIYYRPYGRILSLVWVMQVMWKAPFSNLPRCEWTVVGTLAELPLWLWDASSTPIVLVHWPGKIFGMHSQWNVDRPCRTSSAVGVGPCQFRSVIVQSLLSARCFQGR